MENENKTPITVETTVNAPIAKVWDYWTNPEHITQWSFASPEWHCPKADNDIRVGGKFNSTMAAKDGSMSFDFAGVYTNVITNEQIEYELGDGRKVKVTFTESGENTQVVETFDPENVNPLEMQKGGWQAILDNFKSHVEG